MPSRMHMRKNLVAVPGVKRKEVHLGDRPGVHPGVQVQRVHLGLDLVPDFWQGLNLPPHLKLLVNISVFDSFSYMGVLYNFFYHFTTEIYMLYN